MKRIFTLFLTGVLAFGLNLSAHAIPMSFGTNSYEFVQVFDPYTGSNNSWFTASATAAASVYKGMSGHLATIKSQAENDFLLSLAPVSSTEFFERANLLWSCRSESRCIQINKRFGAISKIAPAKGKRDVS